MSRKEIASGKFSNVPSVIDLLGKVSETAYKSYPVCLVFERKFNIIAHKFLLFLKSNQNRMFTTSMCTMLH